MVISLGFFLGFLCIYMEAAWLIPLLACYLVRYSEHNSDDPGDLPRRSHRTQSVYRIWHCPLRLCHSERRGSSCVQSLLAVGLARPGYQNFWIISVSGWTVTSPCQEEALPSSVPIRAPNGQPCSIPSHCQPGWTTSIYLTTLPTSLTRRHNGNQTRHWKKYRELLPDRWQPSQKD